MEQIKIKSEQASPEITEAGKSTTPLQLAKADIDFRDFSKSKISTAGDDQNIAPGFRENNVLAGGKDGFQIHETPPEVVHEVEGANKPRDFDPEVRDALHRSIKSPEELREIKRELKTHGKDAKTELLKAFRDPNTRVIGLGEFHTNSSDTPHYTFLKSMIGDMKKAGVTHLTLEKKDPQFLKKLLEQPTAHTWRNSDGRLIGPGLIDFIKAAHKAGIKVTAVDTEGNHGKRDRHAAGKISEILGADSKNKILHIGGMNHIREHSKPGQEKSLAQLLMDKGKAEGFKTYFAAMLTSGAGLNKRTGPSYLGNYLDKPTIVDIGKAKKLKDMFINTDEIGYPERNAAKLGKYGKILLMPQFLNYPGKEKPRPPEEKHQSFTIPDTK